MSIIKNFKSSKGFTLVETIFFIVIVSTALAGVLSVLNVTTKSSADPLIKKQMLSIAQGLMDEVRMQTFAWCDPSDAKALTATSVSDCAGVSITKTRGSSVYPLNRVIDYNGLSIASSLSGTAFPTGYSAAITVTPTLLNTIASSESLLIHIEVYHLSETIILESFRTRYSPNNIS